MNETKIKTVFEERDEAIRILNRTSLELNKTNAQLAATEQALQEVQRESAELRQDRDLNRQRVIELQRESLELKQREVRRVSTLRECDQLLIAYGELGILLPPKSSGSGFPPGFDVKRAEKGLAQQGDDSTAYQAEARITQGER